MKAVTGEMSTVLGPLTIKPAGPPETYLGVAQGMMPGVTILAGANPGAPLAMAFVAAHVLECALKAFLSRDGTDERLKRPPLNHDLGALWKLAAAEGLRVPEDPPAWVERLSGVHGSPYYLRYSTGVHGIVLPQAATVATELAAVLDSVREQLRSA
jgi:HEPN domain-containing protein